MDVHEALRTRRTCHAMLPDRVPADVLERALEAAHHAPNHKLTWPWRFYVVGPATRRALADLAVERKTASGPLLDVQERAIRAPLAERGALVVVARVPSDDPFRAREDYAAVACAVMSFLLSLHADGWCGKWGTGALTRDPETRALLGLADGDPVVEGFLYVGRAESLPTVERPPLASVVQTLP